MLDTPTVSVIIPTYGRPRLVCSAIRSALQQTLRKIEINVVTDGPDPDTDASIRELADPRVRVFALPRRSGPAAARNAGIREARAPWVALLDDDDEWLPEKLERQLSMASEAPVPFPILGTRAYVKSPFATYLWPTRRPYPGEHLSEYLFTRRSLFMGEGWYTTASLLTRTELARRVPFDETVCFGDEDNEWLLRAAAHEGVRYDVLWEPLCLYRYEERDHASLTNAVTDWRPSLAWASRERHLFTAKAYAGFCLKVSDRAIPARQWRAFFILLGEAFRHGRPTLTDLVLFIAMWTIPKKLRRRLRAKYFRWKVGPVVAPPPVSMSHDRKSRTTGSPSCHANEA